MEAITSRANPLMTHLRKLSSSAAYRRQRNLEYTTKHEEVMAAKREEQQIREMEETKRAE